MKLCAAMIMRMLSKREAEKVRRFAAKCERLFGPGCQVRIRQQFPRKAENRRRHGRHNGGE